MVFVPGLIEGRGLHMWVVRLYRFFLNLQWLLEHGGYVSSILPFTGFDHFSIDLVIVRKRKAIDLNITSRLKGCDSRIRSDEYFIHMVEGISFL